MALREIRANRFLEREVVIRSQTTEDRLHRIYFVLSGDGVVRLGDSEYQFGDNTILFVPPGAICRFDEIQEVPIDLFCIRFDDPALASRPHFASFFNIKVPESSRDEIVRVLKEILRLSLVERADSRQQIGHLLDLIDGSLARDRIVFATRHVGRALQDIGRHRHLAESQIDYFEQGSGRFWLGDHWEPFRPGDLFFVPPGAYHEICFDAENEIDNFSLKCILEPDAKSSIAGTSFKISYEASRRGEVLPLLQNIVGYYIMKRPIPPSLYLTLLDRIESELIALRNEATTGSDKIDRVTDYIRSNFNLDLSLNRLADRVELNPQYLSRHFREQTGETITAYVQKTKLEHSARLLTETQLPVGAVAEQSGFQNIPYFSAIFRRHFGESPRQFRKSRQRER